MNVTATVSIATAIKDFRYKIIDPENVVLVNVFPKDSRLRHKVSLKALVGVPGMVNLSQCPVIWQGLKDAYFSIPIFKPHRKYLRFFWRG